MNEDPIRNLSLEVLSDNWSTLKKATYEFPSGDGKWETHVRESYDRGNGATVLLYNKQHKNVILTRQFRLPTYLNDNKSGMLIEACAGMLDEDDPETCIKREIEEETGYRIHSVQKIMEAYMSPGAVTEKIHFFVGTYQKEDKIHNGGGKHSEQEHIEVMEVPFSQAVEMMTNGEIIDAKTIILLQYAQINQTLWQ